MVRVPTEVVKSRQQTSAYGRISSLTAFREVLSTEGVAGLYRGYGSTIFREVRRYATDMRFLLHASSSHCTSSLSTVWQATSRSHRGGKPRALAVSPAPLRRPLRPRWM